MAILRDNGRGRFSSNLLLRKATYDTVRTCTFLILQEIKTVKRDIKRRRMVRINKNSGDNDGCRQNPDSLSGIYMTSTKEAKFCIVADNRRNRDETKKNAVRVNAVKKLAYIIKRGGSFENILSTLENIWSYTNTLEDSTESVLQVISDLSYDTLKDNLFHLVENISDLLHLKKRTVVVETVKRWGKCIIEEGAITVLKEEDGVREGVIAYLRGRNRIEQGG